MPERREAVLLRGLARERRAAGRHRQPRRPLDPGRVPRPLGSRRPRGERPVRRGEGAPARAARRAAEHEAALRPPPAPAGARRAWPCSGAARRSAAAQLFHAEIEGYDELLDLDLTAPGRRAARPSAAARLHARQARPLLRPLRPAAVQGARGAGRGRLGLAVVARRRRPLRRQRRLSCPRACTSAGSSPADAWSVLDEYLAGRIDLDHYRGRSAYTFAEQAAERGDPADDRATRDRATSSWSSTRARTSGSAPVSAHLRRRRRLRAGRADLPDLQRRDAQASRGTTPQESFANQPPDEHEPALVVEPAGKVGGGEGRRPPRRSPRSRRARGRGTRRACPRTRASSPSRSAITVGRRSSGVSTVTESSSRTSSRCPSRIGRRLSTNAARDRRRDRVRRRAARRSRSSEVDRRARRPRAPTAGTRRRPRTRPARRGTRRSRCGR